MEQELQSLGLKYYKNSFKSMEVSSRNIQRTLWSTVRPSIRKFLNCNPLLTSGTLVKDWKRQILSWELEQVIWNQKAQAHLIKKQGMSSEFHPHPGSLQ